jgi:ATP-dependent Clp protease ATP-binding subunit ClpA
MYSKDLDKVLRDTWLLARTDNHAFVSIEHLLHAIVLDETGHKILYAAGVDLAILHDDIQEFYTQIEKISTEEEPTHTVIFKRVIQHCLLHAHAAEQKEVGIGDVLISMFTEEESHAVYFLRKQGIERLDIMISKMRIWMMLSGMIWMRVLINSILTISTIQMMTRMKLRQRSTI